MHLLPLDHEPREKVELREHKAKWPDDITKAQTEQWVRCNEMPLYVMPRWTERRRSKSFVPSDFTRLKCKKHSCELTEAAHSVSILSVSCTLWCVL